MKAYLEVGSLIEVNWTGIPVVAAALVEHALADVDSGIEWQFLFETVPLPRDLVRQMLDARSGRAAQDNLVDLIWNTRPVDVAEAKSASCIYTNIKPMRDYFGREAMIIHDLSPLITPQFHNIDTINHFANRIDGDVKSTDHFFCVSEATRRDLQSYLGVERAATSIIRLGMDLKWEDVSLAQRLHDEFSIEPYVVVVGTLEPRKNGRIVLQYLASNPGFANRYRIVFVGREGWLDERKKLMDDIIAHGVSPDRVHFTGYVTEQEKIALIYNSQFCIYPSFFEGFGLPVLEASVLGKTIVCSNSSSMPEVAPEKCCFFSPANLPEFTRAIAAAEMRARLTRKSGSLEDVMACVMQHGWGPCYDKVKQWVMA